MIISIEGEVNEEMLSKIAKAYSELKPSDKMKIYFTTAGGDVDIAEAVIDLINDHKDITEVKFYGDVFSAGMIIFLRLECIKTLLSDVRGMLHFISLDITINEGGKSSSEYGKFMTKEMKKSLDKSVALWKRAGLTDKEIATIKKGKDVFFTHERMIELNGK